MAPFLFLLSLFLISPARAAGAEEDCVNELRDISKQLNLRVACNTIEIAKKILEGQELVPRYLYHFAKKEHVLQNAKERTIPENVWNDSIMGEKNRRFALRPIRRGLYGTHNLDTNGFYDSGSYSWLMQIELEPACRNPQKVATFSGLEKDPRFIAWFKKKASLPMSLEDFAKKCPSSPPDYIAVYAGDERERCIQLAERFISENDIKIIQDSVVSRSFYIRNRSCIKNIRGTAAEQLEFLADEPSIFISECYGPPLDTTLSSVFTRLLMEDIVNEPVSEDVLDKLALNIQLFQSLYSRENAQNALNAFRVCRKANPTADCRPKVRTALKSR